jgi:CheY-like chemotaxis protein
LVLLVEDYEPNILVASVFLESLHYDIEIARSGEEALEKIVSNKYYAVLMDVQMPGMDGLDVTRRVREKESEERTERLYIIGMTAHAMKGDREKCLASGMDDYISKPVSQDTIKVKLELVKSVR